MHYKTCAPMFDQSPPVKFGATKSHTSIIKQETLLSHGDRATLHVNNKLKILLSHI